MNGTTYQMVNQKHNVWRCDRCGHMEHFEADGPFENGWDFCPHCGRPILRGAEDHDGAEDL